MTIQESLKYILAPLEERIARELARGEGVRSGFLEELTRFYGLLEQTIVTGDSAWLDPILYDWGRSPTETNLEEADYNVSFVISRMIALTIDVAREKLTAEAALELLAVVIPIYTHSLSVVVRYEMEARLAHISRELAQTQDKLEQIDRSKSNFISVAAHELKTPLTLIEGYTSMMTDMPGQAPPERLLEGVTTGIKRLRRIIDDMLDVSLIDNNLLTLNFQPVKISHLLRLIKNELSAVVSDRNQDLIVADFEGKDLTIHGDAERLYQALLNVTSNAIKYTPDQGSIAINGRLLPGFVEIAIIDTGIGISPENQSIIFDNFSQLGRTDLHSSGRTKFKGGGPGLGLPITRGIIEAHGGSIWVESEGFDEVKLPGSTFHILLPTRNETAGPQDGKLPDQFEQIKLETDSIGKEDPPTNNSPA